MHLEAFDGIGKPIKLPITRVVIYDDFGNPVAMAVKHRPGFLYVGHVRDPEFATYLEALGIRQTVIVDTIDPTNLPPLDPH